MIGLNWTPLALSSPAEWNDGIQSIYSSSFCLYQSGFTKIEIERRFLILVTNFGYFLMYTFKEMTSCWILILVSHNFLWIYCPNCEINEWLDHSQSYFFINISKPHQKFQNCERNLILQQNCIKFSKWAYMMSKFPIMFVPSLTFQVAYYI